MESQESGTAATLADLVRQGVDAAQIADVIVSTWKKIDTVLSPIVGHQGVVALYNRSLQINCTFHPWLAGMRESDEVAIALAALTSVLTQQSSTDAAACGIAILQTFHDLLAGVIGPELTERLLAPTGSRAGSESATVGAMEE